MDINISNLGSPIMVETLFSDLQSCLSIIPVTLKELGDHVLKRVTLKLMTQRNITVLNKNKVKLL